MIRKLLFIYSFILLYLCNSASSQTIQDVHSILKQADDTLGNITIESDATRYSHLSEDVTYVQEYKRIYHSNQHGYSLHAFTVPDGNYTHEWNYKFYRTNGSFVSHILPDSWEISDLIDNHNGDDVPASMSFSFVPPDNYLYQATKMLNNGHHVYDYEIRDNGEVKVILKNKDDVISGIFNIIPHQSMVASKMMFIDEDGRTILIENFNFVELNGKHLPQTTRAVLLGSMPLEDDFIDIEPQLVGTSTLLINNKRVDIFNSNQMILERIPAGNHVVDKRSSVFKAAYEGTELPRGLGFNEGPEFITIRNRGEQVVSKILYITGQLEEDYLLFDW